jgi:hypothetical protein
MVKKIGLESPLKKPLLNIINPTMKKPKTPCENFRIVRPPSNPLLSFIHKIFVGNLCCQPRHNQAYHYYNSGFEGAHAKKSNNVHMMGEIP